MRLAWKTAIETSNYDYYIWLNDDTMLAQHALIELLECNSIALVQNSKEAIIVGSCKVSKMKNDFSYGGRTDKGAVIPNGKLQACSYVNGNIVLIPQQIYQQLGILSNNYTHGIGDYDYGLRAINKDFKCYITKTYIATCPPNVGIPIWCNPQKPLKERWKSFYTPLGLNIKEYNQFRKKFWGKKWMLFAIKAYAKMLFPNVYTKIVSK